MRKETFKIEWGAPEHEHKRRSADWFWAMGIVVFAIVITSIILGNIIFAILVLVSVFALTLFINKEPEIIDVIITEIGISREQVLYPWNTLDSFWIDEEHPHKKIILKSKKLLMPLIIIPLGDKVNVDKLHDTLLQFIDEEFHDLPFAEKILEYFGF